jgi:hypothetical protein
MQSHSGRLFACAFAAAATLCASAASGASLDTNPAFPSYGDTVSLQLNDTDRASWFPGTRYRRDGRTITLEIEQVTGGFFGPRPDMISRPTILGEIAPGAYTLQARVFDMGNGDAPPRLVTRTLDVAAPEAPGVYPVPRAPGAYESFQLLVRADAGIDASSLRATLEGTTVRIDFDFSSDPAAASFAPVKVAGLAPGLYHAQASGRVPNLMAPARGFGGDFNVGASTPVIEYYAPGLDHYFISAWPDEIALLDAGTAFERTGERFRAWLKTADAPASAVPVCRFYASGPNSHFYTADPVECQSLKSLEQKQRADAEAKGQSFPGWQFEAIAFFALAPENGACPANSQPVYRTYNGRAAENDSNHRFMVRQPVRDAMLMGWTEEGIAFCAPL